MQGNSDKAVELEKTSSIAGESVLFYDYYLCGGSSERWELIYLMIQPFLGLYPNKDVSYQRISCLTIFFAILFIRDRNLKQPECPTKKEWINTMWIENEIMKFSGKHMY